MAFHKPFVKLFSKDIGRRTGMNVRVGKKIQLRTDGREHFDDYLSDSDGNNTWNASHIEGIREESEAQEQSEKLKTFNKKDNISRNDHKATSSQMSQKVISSQNMEGLSNSELNEVSQKGNRSKFAWLRNKNIGRRTGKDFKADKKIRIDGQGVEIFEDYLSESDTSTQSSHHSTFSSIGGLQNSALGNMDSNAPISTEVTPHVQDSSSEISQESVTNDGTKTITRMVSTKSQLAQTVSAVLEKSTELRHKIRMNDREESSGKDVYMDTNSEIDNENKSSADCGAVKYMNVKGTSGLEKDEGDVEDDIVAVNEVEDDSTVCAVGNDNEDVSDEKNHVTNEIIDSMQSTKQLHQRQLSFQSSKTAGNQQQISQSGNITHKSNESFRSQESNILKQVAGKLMTLQQVTEDDLIKDKIKTSEKHPGINVAGNLSGSITKSESPISVTSFNQTKKRLSFSCLDASEEAKILKKSRIEKTNIDIQIDGDIYKSKSDVHTISVIPNKTLQSKSFGKLLSSNTSDDDRCVSIEAHSMLSSTNEDKQQSEDEDEIVILEDNSKFGAFGHKKVNVKGKTTVKTSKNDNVNEVASQVRNRPKVSHLESKLKRQKTRKQLKDRNQTRMKSMKVSDKAMKSRKVEAVNDDVYDEGNSISENNLTVNNNKSGQGSGDHDKKLQQKQAHKIDLEGHKSRKNKTVWTSTSQSSSKVHFHETSKSDTTKPVLNDESIIEDGLIRPEPAPDGLRRSQRTRLKPVAWYKNERVVFDHTRRSGPAIVGVKPSLEVKWNKLEEEKHKKRMLLRQLRKAAMSDKKEASHRKLSMHTNLPTDIEIDDSKTDITVWDPISQTEDGLECIAKSGSFKPVGPDHGSPKAEDAYLITVLLEHPGFVVGKLIIRPSELKPEQLVTANYVVFYIEYGKVLVRIYKTSTILETGDTFFVPVGNTYSIQNLRNDTAKLVYNINKQILDNDSLMTMNNAKSD